MLDDKIKGTVQTIIDIGPNVPAIYATDLVLRQKLALQGSYLLESNDPHTLEGQHVCRGV